MIRFANLVCCGLFVALLARRSLRMRSTTWKSS